MSDRPVALITGGSRGLGAAVARALAPTHDLILGGRGGGKLGEVCKELGARPFPVELTEVTARDVEGLGRIDLLVHSAGVVTLGPVGETPIHVWRETFEVNVFAVAELTRLLLPSLRAAKGQVVLVNSGAGQRAHPDWGSYAASKWALRAYADVLRQEEPDLRVTTVYPGRIDTDMQRDVRVQEGGEYEPHRYLRAESVAGAVVAAVTAPADAHLTEVIVRPR
ncbi:SDR family oxidoreductase [Herbidospora sp. RD11066]